jgi:RecA-family ATPase
VSKTPTPDEAERAARQAVANRAGPPGPQVVILSDVEPERVTWLWEGYLPRGKVVILDGDPGVGKSTVSLDIAARITTGSPMPDGSAPVKGAVLILSAEDGIADTIRPRLDAAGADPAQVITITGIISYNDDGERYSRTVEIPGDLLAIEQVIGEHAVVLAVVDVLMAYLSAQVNSHRDQDVRRALHVLSGVAERTGCCIVILRHLNKASGGSPMYRGGGSIGIVGAARAGFMIGTDPDDGTGRTRVLAPVKCNLAEEPPALAYHLVNDELRGCARVQWDGISGHKAASLLAEPGEPDERSERDEAAGWLVAYLTELGGEAEAKDVKRAARAAGFADRTVDRARKRAGVTTGRNGFGKGAVYVWRIDLSCTPHARHGRQGEIADDHGEHGGEHGEEG